MKMRVLITLLIVILPLISSSPTPTTTPDCQGCQEYQCLDDTVAHCGANGYMIADGLFYCKRFEQYYNDFNTAGKAFVDCVKPALLDYVRGYLSALNGTTVDCIDLENKVFDSHVPIYLECNFCNVWLPNLGAFAEVLWTNIAQPTVWYRVLEIFLKC